MLSLAAAHGFARRGRGDLCRALQRVLSRIRLCRFINDFPLMLQTQPGAERVTPFVVVTELYEENYPVCWTTSPQSRSPAPCPRGPEGRESAGSRWPSGSTPASPGPRPHHWGQADHLRGLPASAAGHTSAAASVHLSAAQAQYRQTDAVHGASGNWEHKDTRSARCAERPTAGGLGVSQEVKSRTAQVMAATIT